MEKERGVEIEVQGEVERVLVVHEVHFSVCFGVGKQIQYGNSHPPSLNNLQWSRYTINRVTHSLTDDVVPLPGNRFWYRDVSVFANAKGSSRNLRFAIETFFHKVLGD